MAPNRLMMYLRNLRYGPAFRRFNFFAFEFPVLEPWERFPHHSHGFLEFSISGVWDGETDLDQPRFFIEFRGVDVNRDLLQQSFRYPDVSAHVVVLPPWCLMPNHWHLVLWPWRDGDLAAF